MSYQYSYLIGTVIMLIIWFLLFFWRKDVRKEMLVISLIFSILGFLEIIYVRDWWRPLTITNTIPGIESFLYCFTFAGIVAVIYEEFFKKKIRIRKLGKKRKELNNIKFMILLGILAALFLICIYLLNLNTLQATLIVLIFGTIYIWIQRKDLIIDSIYTSILAVVIMVPVYIITEYITPGVVQEFQLFQNIPNIVILKVPLDDIIFYIAAGAFIGPLYEYWQEGRMIKK